MPNWMQGFCLGAIIATIVYLLLTLWAALTIGNHEPEEGPEQ